MRHCRRTLNEDLNAILTYLQYYDVTSDRYYTHAAQRAGSGSASQGNEQEERPAAAALPPTMKASRDPALETQNPSDFRNLSHLFLFLLSINRIFSPLIRKPCTLGYGPNRNVNQYTINTRGASNINFKRVKNK